jgi:hypothetical protein
MKAIALSAIVLLTCASASAQEPGSIGYRTVADALAALRKDPTAKFSTQAGWVIVDVREGPHYGLWSFTPNTHPAYPAAMRRTPTEVGGAIYLTMQVRCEAAKRVCAQLVEDFKKLNEQMKRDIQSRHKSSK